MKTHDFLTEIQKGSEPSPYQDPIAFIFVCLSVVIYTFFKPVK
ncbi:hypothetical protein KNN_00519 [Bacillus thuringiensis serovar tolworthi]|jgi:hypothetical protein|uniref:Uncharacterized protein n=2 Tax=Bacillus cereus group TaxID=86661 RepID=A0A9W4A1L0_BACTO|nr:hypothetical protein FORC13_4953 [Bacillus cereus]EJR31794.1 hypothetical protein IIE_04268 [Bacillus cereus VD045]EJR77275.1 hypothetical protein IK9_04137 [Bacillus cereus VD166]EJR86729.1 hypothetical protein IKA_04666 [Bacillus cereus VD169]EOO64517.1 hypothetical protein IKE_04057 [Bacillus cereus VD196]SDJ60946.1 hypothetical protein SAMN04488578_11718 [Bacillus sp. cl96]SEB13288.1 hypothetical protein SAMN04488575_11818 [Bacillus sp. cl115]SHK10034.1 hypothetical protein SAMN044885